MQLFTVAETPVSLSPLRPLPSVGILLPFHRGRRFVPASQILALQSVRNYTRLFFDDGRTLLYSRTLRHMLTILPAYAFIRIHRSHAVNRQHIRATTGLSVTLMDDSKWAISRRKKKGGN